MPVPVAARSKAWVCGRSLAAIVGSNPTGGMDVCLLFVLSGRGFCEELMMMMIMMMMIIIIIIIIGKESKWQLFLPYRDYLKDQGIIVPFQTMNA
jgi:hypothetical protein